MRSEFQIRRLNGISCGAAPARFTKFARPTATTATMGTMTQHATATITGIMSSPLSHQNGLIPRRPANRRLHISVASSVDAMSITLDRLAHGERQPPPWLISRYHPLPNINTVMPRKGHVSARNAGAEASPADVPPKRPSRPGMTHHQGKGRSPLNSARNGTSTCSNFSIASPFHD